MAATKQEIATLKIILYITQYIFHSKLARVEIPMITPIYYVKESLIAW